MCTGGIWSRVWRLVFMAILLVALFLVASQVAGAQGVANPTRETAVGLKNSSSHFLIFFIDDRIVGGIPSGESSGNFPVTPGEHSLRAETFVNGEKISASRTVFIHAGFAYTWTTTNPLARRIEKREQL
jgi:uncharacterized membrane protein